MNIESVDKVKHIRSARDRDADSKLRSEKIKKFLQKPSNGSPSTPEPITKPGALKNLGTLRQLGGEKEVSEKEVIHKSSGETTVSKKVRAEVVDDSCCEQDIPPIVECEVVNECVALAEELERIKKEEWLAKLIKKYKDCPNNCDLLNIIHDFYPDKPRDYFPLFDVCNIDTSEIQLNLNDFYYGDERLDSVPRRTTFRYKGCDAPNVSDPSIKYWPLTSASTPDNENCSTQYLLQNSLQTQITVPQDLYPGSLIKIKLNLLAFPPSSDYIERKLNESGITIPTDPQTGTLIKTQCLPNEVSAITVSLDSIHLCDVKNDFKPYGVNSLLPTPPCAKEDRFKLFGRSCDFTVYEYRNLTEYSFTLINIDIIIKPLNPLMIRPGDLLIINIARTDPLVTADTPLMYGLAAASIQYSKAPINLEDIIRKLYEDRDKWGTINECGLCNPNILDKCLNTFTSCDIEPQTRCYIDNYNILSENVSVVQTDSTSSKSVDVPVKPVISHGGCKQCAR